MNTSENNLMIYGGIMERLTKEIDKKVYLTAEKNIDKVQSNYKEEDNIWGYSGDAINKLAKFENLYENLILSQEETIEKLEKLRKEGKTNTVTFKQLLAKKMTNDNFINLFHIYGIE